MLLCIGAIIQLRPNLDWATASAMVGMCEITTTFLIGEHIHGTIDDGFSLLVAFRRAACDNTCNTARLEAHATIKTMAIVPSRIAATKWSPAAYGLCFLVRHYFSITTN